MPNSPEKQNENWRNRFQYSTDDKIDDVCELMKDRRLDIICMNETKRKGSGGAIKRGSFDTYWSSVDQSQSGCCGVDFILSERLYECVNSYKCVNPKLWNWTDEDFYFKRICLRYVQTAQGAGVLG
ncbi:hypothetical protein EVAR_25886_1 [Eumeta japonica]|uniref:Endonuclease/exonuclease/phosphatase domain-containing protein n=1 Tax=Eumeta variegata TaxID=151549 RepID=A0A4C1W295_EUMVA|nr:hypothetical protein EVAR_25886_1 [Eumeta japonica]